MSKLKLSLWIPLLAVTLATSDQSFGASIPVSYSFTGSATSFAMSGNFLLLTGVAFGTVNSWSGVEFDTTDSIDLTTGIDNGSFSITLPDGDQAFGALFEDDSQVTDSGPFTQKLTFTSGTGQLVGVSGVLGGNGFVFPDYYTSSGDGTLTAAGLTATPEPGTWLLVLSGCGLGVVSIRKRRIAQVIPC